MTSVERHVGTHRCERCGVEFAVVSGAIRDNDHPLGSYIVGLHGRPCEQRKAQLALAILDRRAPEVSPIAVALEVSASSRELHMTVVEWTESEWAGESYLGRMLGKAEVIHNPLRPLLLDMADRVLQAVSEARAYFAQ